MEPTHNSDFSPASELPQPEGVTGQEFNAPQPAAPEARGFQPPAGQGTAVPLPTIPATPMPTTQPTDDSSVQNQPTSVAATAALVADDADLIEKEWVLKAKAIVMQTRSDPHMQNVKMNDVKADYLKKRYNKDIKTSGS